jgi:hypothetical protein
MNAVPAVGGVVSRLAVHQGDVRAAEQAGTDSLELYRELGDTAMGALSLQQLGRSAQLRADFDKARRLLEETLSAYPKSRNSRMPRRSSLIPRRLVIWPRWPESKAIVRRR